MTGFFGLLFTSSTGARFMLTPICLSCMPRIFAEVFTSSSSSATPMAMAPGMKLSSFRQVSVVARVSRQGGVSAQPGDLEGGGEPLTLNGGEQAVRLLIDRTI